MSSEAMALGAVKLACADSGIDPRDIDGIVKLSYDGSISTMALARELNARSARFSVELPMGGGSTGSVLEVAKMAVESGIVKSVVCFRSVTGAQWKVQLNGPDQHRLYYLDTVNYLRPVGWTGYQHLFAAMFSEYAHRYGTGREALGRVAVELRNNAIAAGNRPSGDAFDLDQYLSAPTRIGPFSSLDEFTVGDFAAAFVVTDDERVGDRSRPVAEILATAQSHGSTAMGWHDLHALSHRSLDGPVRSVAEQLYASSGTNPGNVDVSLLYDCTSFTFLFGLEQALLCKPGSAQELIVDGALRADGPLPANTDGGDLSAGYTHGFRHIVEAVQQVRGTAANQVPGAEIAMYMGGPVGVTSGALVRRKELS